MVGPEPLPTAQQGSIQDFDHGALRPGMDKFNQFSEFLVLVSHWSAQNAAAAEHLDWGALQQVRFCFFLALFSLKLVSLSSSQECRRLCSKAALQTSTAARCGQMSFWHQKFLLCIWHF